MKKTRRIKMVVTTREVLAVRQNSHDDVSAYSDSHICPFCHSPLAEPLQISREIQGSTALLLAEINDAEGGIETPSNSNSNKQETKNEE